LKIKKEAILLRQPLFILNLKQNVPGRIRIPFIYLFTIKEEIPEKAKAIPAIVLF
jgi:hypothetical protein